MTSRTTRTTSRTIRTIQIRSPPKGGLLMGRVLMVLEVVLVALEVTGPPVPWGKFRIRKSLRPGLYSLAPPIDINEDPEPSTLPNDDLSSLLSRLSSAVLGSQNRLHYTLQ